jgi:hypothetical protein
MSIGAVIAFGAAAGAFWALERARKKRDELTGRTRRRR